MSARQLSLTDAQLSLVQEAAKAIPPDFRSRFLEACADRLLPLDAVTDCAVSEAVHFVLERMHLSADPQCVGDRA